MTPHAKGVLITATGGLALSFDIPLLKLGGGDAWSILLVRSAGGLLAGLVLWQLARWVTGRPIALLPGRSAPLVAALYGAAAIFFVLAVQHTIAANIVFIIAFTSMFAALMSWALFGERPARSTLLTMAVMVLAVIIIVGDGLQTGSVLGDLFALCAAILLAAAITLARASRQDMGFAPLVGGLLPLAVAGLVLGLQGRPAELDAPFFIVINGMVMLPVAFWCLATGPKYITAPEVGMFYLLETVLAPIWVWLIFAEAPTPAVLTGGTLLIGALLAHSIWQIVQARRQLRCRGNAAPCT